MDSGVFRGLLTLVLLLIFVGIWLWAWSGKRKKSFEEAAQLALEDEDQADNAKIEKQQEHSQQEKQRDE